MDRAQADYMGILATIINGLALQETLERLGQPPPGSRPPSRWPLRSPSPSHPASIRHLEKGRVVIFVGGTGNPFMTTDTTAAPGVDRRRRDPHGQERHRRRLHCGP